MRTKRASVSVKNDFVTPIKLKVPQVSIRRGLKQSLNQRSPKARFYYKPDTRLDRDASTKTLENISRNN